MNATRFKGMADDGCDAPRFVPCDPAEVGTLSQEARDLGASIAAGILRNKTILGVFDVGCMGMYNAILTDELLMPMGVFKERPSQSALYLAAREVPEDEARAVYDWLVERGPTFHFGPDPAKHLTEAQVVDQCRM